MPSRGWWSHPNNAGAKGEGLPQKLSIAILWDDGVVIPHPPIISALKKCRDALVMAGHDIIDWQPLDHKKGWDLIVRLFLQMSKADRTCNLRLSCISWMVEPNIIKRCHHQGSLPSNKLGGSLTMLKNGVITL
jgi:Asp-tRNA(Asn)/Glu-tRNA(Gln) amidotransferase A subunit family amidase